MKLFIRRLSEFSQSEYNECVSLMAEERRTAIERYRIEDDRRRTVLGEYIAKQAISEICKTDIREVIILKDERGKPYCRSHRIEFSIAHSGDTVVCAVSDRPIGVDVEEIRETDLRVHRIACNDREKNYIFESENGQNERFLRVWTAKEAYFKFLGTGITNLKSVDYFEILPNCKTEIGPDRIITVYCEN